MINKYTYYIYIYTHISIRFDPLTKEYKKSPSIFLALTDQQSANINMCRLV